MIVARGAPCATKFTYKMRLGGKRDVGSARRNIIIIMVFNLKWMDTETDSVAWLNRVI